MSSEVKPGMLCEDGNGAWHLVGWTPCGSPTGRLIGMGGGCLNTAKPLAPAPTPGALWDALKGIPGAKQRPDGHAGRSITLRGEAGDITINPDAVGSSNAVRYSTWGVVSDHNADAVERDLQKRRALAAYAAQPGWGGGDG